MPRLAGEDRLGPPPPTTSRYPLIAVVDSGMWSGFDDFAGYLDDESADCVNEPIGAARRMQHPSDVERHRWATAPRSRRSRPRRRTARARSASRPTRTCSIVRVTVDGALRLTCAFNYLASVAGRVPAAGRERLVRVPGAPSGQRSLALDRLIRAGALVVAAAGNTDDGPVQWPANAPHVLAVGPRRRRRRQRASNLDIVAPGAHLLLPDRVGQWTTSRPVRHVVRRRRSWPGAAARVWGMFAIDDPQVIAYLLRKNAKPIGRAGFGSGCVNIRAALAAGRRSCPSIEESEPNDTAVARPGEARLQADVQAPRPRHDERRQLRLLAADRAEQVPEAGQADGPAGGVVGGVLPAAGTAAYVREGAAQEPQPRPLHRQRPAPLSAR